jgi:hypothetical protein
MEHRIGIVYFSFLLQMICIYCLYLRLFCVIIGMYWCVIDTSSLPLYARSFVVSSYVDTHSADTNTVCRSHLLRVVDSIGHTLLSLDKAPRKDSTALALLAMSCRTASREALQCRYNVIAMFFVSLANNTVALHRVGNILLFRMTLRDMQIVLQDIERRLRDGE